MERKRSLLAELKRRNVLRAGVLYVGAVWALAQVITQLGPLFHAPEWAMRWFVIACAIGFPVWLGFAWFYELTPEGLKRESQIVPGESMAGRTGRKLDSAIIAVLAVVVVLLVTNQFVLHRDATSLADRSEAKSLAATLAVVPPQSIAVLPLANDSGDKSQQYFSDALSQDLITALTQFEGLKVISRESAFQFRDSKASPQTIAAKLGVAHLLEGSVQHQGEVVRISVTLVNAADGSTLWAQHYDKPYTDLFALQDAITQAVATSLKAKLLATSGAMVQSERPPGGNLAAWQAYQQGRFYYARNTQADHDKALAQYAMATRLDPRYAAAYAAASRVWIQLASAYLTGAEKQQAFVKARASIETALTLEPGLAMAHTVHSDLLSRADFDWRGAQAESLRAAQLAPADVAALISLGNLDATLGRVQSAVALTRKALASDPLHATLYNWLAVYLSGVGRLDEAQLAVAKAIELQPAADQFHGMLATIATQRGDAKAALAAAQKESDPGWRRISLALAAQVGADRNAADAALQTLVARDADRASYQIAEVYALRRDPDNMFKWLDRAWAARDPGVQNLLADPIILRYRDDPRFTAFCNTVGLPTTTDAVAMKM